ncbi:hypothetical protein TNCV_1528001 [Trichonephila clavipes]|nr:hypothetical protein TNCV_1528001 [Trichonephila clavipes]
MKNVYERFLRKGRESERRVYERYLRKGRESERRVYERFLREGRESEKRVYERFLRERRERNSRSERPVASVSDENMEKVSKLISKDCQLTACMIAVR